MYSPCLTKGILDDLEEMTNEFIRTVFDPCIGWGGRMLGTTSRGGHYTGCEPFTKTHDGLCEMIEDLGLHKCVKIYKKGVEEVLSELEDTYFDVCITSPPYYDLEVYSEEDTQSIQLYNTYEEWLDGFIRPIIEYVCSHVIYYSCWSVKNFKTDKQYNLLDDVINIHKEYGWKLIKEYRISNGSDHTYVFTHS